MTLKELQYLRSKVTDPIGIKLIAREMSIITMAADVAVKVAAQPKQDWDRMCGMYSLKPEHFGRTFRIRGTVYEVVGLSPNRPKYAIQSKRVRDGKVFGVPAIVLQREFAA